MKTVIESYLPVFQGFYNTIFSCDCEEDYIEDGKTSDDYTFDYAEYHQRVAKACVSPIQEQLKDFGITVEFQELYSPKFYNNSTDVINVEYTLQKDSLQKVIDYLKENKEAFAKHIEKTCTSYDGFISFFSNDVDAWLSEYLQADNIESSVFGNVMEFIMEIEEYRADDLYYAISDEINYIDYELKEVA